MATAQLIIPNPYITGTLTVANISSPAGASLNFQVGGVTQWSISTAGGLAPANDNTQAIGGSTSRISTFTGATLTSGSSAPVAADTSGLALTIRSQPGSAASATGGGAGATLTLESAVGGDGTAGLAAGHGGDINVVTLGGGANNGGGGARSGNLALNVGLGTSVNGTIGIGNGANAPGSITIGQVGVTTTIAGTLALTTISVQSLAVTNTTNQIVFGATNTTTFSVSAPAASRTITFADPLGSDSVAYLAATQTLTNKTISAPTISGSAQTWSANMTITSGSAATNTTAVVLNPKVADGATSVALRVDNQTTLSTAGALLLSLRNNGTTALTVDFNGTIVSKAGIAGKYRSANPTVTVAGTDYFVGVTGSGARTVNLPAASAFAAGQVLIIQDIGNSAGTITVNPNGTDDINGVNGAVTLAAAYGKKEFFSDGSTNWWTDVSVI